MLKSPREVHIRLVYYVISSCISADKQPRIMIKECLVLTLKRPEFFDQLLLSIILNHASRFFVLDLAITTSL